MGRFPESAHFLILKELRNAPVLNHPSQSGLKLRIWERGIDLNLYRVFTIMLCLAISLTCLPIAAALAFEEAAADKTALQTQGSQYRFRYDTDYPANGKTSEQHGGICIIAGFGHCDAGHAYIRYGDQCAVFICGKPSTFQKSKSMAACLFSIRKAWSAVLRWADRRRAPESPAAYCPRGCAWAGSPSY